MQVLISKLLKRKHFYFLTIPTSKIKVLTLDSPKSVLKWKGIEFKYSELTHNELT